MSPASTQKVILLLCLLTVKPPIMRGFAYGVNRGTASADIAETVQRRRCGGVLLLSMGKSRTAELRGVNFCSHLHLWGGWVFRVMESVVALWTFRLVGIAVAVLGV